MKSNNSIPSRKSAVWILNITYTLRSPKIKLNKVTKVKNQKVSDWPQIKIKMLVKLLKGSAGQTRTIY